jgi:hypothetical protein
MSPYETPERIDTARTHPLIFERKNRPTTVFPPDTPRVPPSFERKKKGRQNSSRPSTVAGDGKGKTFEKVTSWVESSAFEPGVDPRNFKSMVDSPPNSRPIAALDGTLSEPEGRRTRSRSITGFFKRDSKRSTKVPKEPKEPKEKERKSTDIKRTTRRSSKREHLTQDRDDKSLRSVRSEMTLDITRPSQPATPEPPLPMTAAQKFRMKVEMPLSRGKGKRASLSDSDYSPDSDVPDEVKPRAL